MNNIIKSALKFCLLATTFLSTETVLASERISKITIEGNQRVETSTIQSYLGCKVGDEYSSTKENASIKSLYASSLFDNIFLSFTNGHLIVKVQENPFVSKIGFSGNSKIRNAALLKEMLTKSGESLSKAKIEADAEKIKEMYKRSGRFAARVEPFIETQENNRVKVTFKIQEGPKTGIRNISFIGNSNYSARDLRSVILTKESRWFRFLDTNDTYDPDRIEYDKELLKEFYRSLGYADFNVLSSTAELSQTKEYFTLTFVIEEGQRYKLNNISINNKLKNVDTQAIQKFIKVKPGETFNAKMLDKIADNIASYLGNAGYPEVDVYPETKNNASNQTVDVVFVIDKADKIYVGKINILGNLKTEEKVIRREFKIAEGDVFNRSSFEKGEQNLRNLDYFEKISTKIKPTNSKDRYDVDINLEEKSTSSIGFDLGYNTAGGPFGRLSFLEKNLIGTGKYLSAGVQMARKSTYYYAGLTEPHFLDRDLSLSGNAFRSHSGKSGGFGYAEQSYNLKSTGFKTALGYDIFEDLNHELTHVIKHEELTHPSGNKTWFMNSSNKFTTSSVGQTLTYDKTDSRIVPKNGYIISLSQEYAGVGGQNKYLKHDLDTKYFISFVNNKLTLKFAGNAGDIRGIDGKMVRISDRFNLGDYSLRGFAFGGIGPRDIQTDNTLGGQRYYSFSTELTFPIGAPDEFNLSGAVFTDIGGLWDVELDSKTKYAKSLFYDDRSMRASVGCGLIWVTRFAPIRIDWAIPIKKKPYDDTQRFHFKFATHF